MGIRTGYFCFLLSLLFVANVCHAGEDQTMVEVFGAAECAGCEENNVKTSQAFKGLKTTIECKPENGEFKTRGSDELDAEGNFKVSLPEDMVKDGKLKEECYARLHSAAADPCPAHNDDLESSKVVLKSESDGKHSFGLKGKLKFSPVTCASAFLLPPFKHPKLPKLPPINKKPLPPPIPVFEKPLPPQKPLPPKPLPPQKPLPPKPLPPQKPLPPKPLPPPIPVLEKPLPPPIPIPKEPFFKPHPPLLPKFPPKPEHFPHPKFGKFPPLPPLVPHP